jgi:membrane protease YdiL (CAAX protease family)
VKASESPFRRLPPLTARRALGGQAAFYAGLAAIVALLTIRIAGGLPPVRFAPTWGDAAWGAIGVAGYLAYNAVAQLLLSALPGGRHVISWLARRNVIVFGNLPLGVLVALAVMAGVFEELIFRGWLQPIAGLSMTSLVFALAHFPPHRCRWAHPVTWGMIALYFPVGLGLGALYTMRGNLFAPVLSHLVSDALGLMVIARGVRRAAAGAEPTPSARTAA